MASNSTNHALKKRERDDKDLKPPCQYGSKCYRTNSEHLKEFSHPECEKMYFYQLLIFILV